MAATDTYSTVQKFDVQAPANGVEVVSPSDSTDLTKVSRALYIGSGGNVAVIMVDGSTGNFASVPTGAILPVRVSRVTNANTTASSILSLY